jgi:hypothetical protein
MKAVVEANFNAVGIHGLAVTMRRSNYSRKELSRLSDVVADMYVRPDLGASTFAAVHLIPYLTGAKLCNQYPFALQS